MGEPLSILKLIVQASVPVQIVIALLLLAPPCDSIVR